MQTAKSRSRWASTVVAVLGTAVLCPLANPVTASASSASNYVGVVNRERVSRGLAPLHVAADLTSVAHNWVVQMAATRLLRHNPQLDSQVDNWSALGENVGTGASLGVLSTALWHSAEHRANILDDDYTQMGVATARGGGRLWIAVVFRRPMQSGTTVVRRHIQSSGTDSQSRLPVRRPLLIFGATGRAVAVVQRLLGVSADGIFGRITRRAVVNFQRAHHLSADGIVGPRTWAALVQVRT